MIASWTARSVESEDAFKRRLSSVFKATNRLRMAIGEKFTSADLDILVFKCDKIYDPATMDDAHSGYGRHPSRGGKRASEAIVGTTGIGLGKLIMDRGAKDVHRLQTMIPAKIVLRSTLNEALEGYTIH